MIEIVSATRASEEEFWRQVPLGISLRRLAWDRRLVPRIAFDNRRGLPEVYNARIAEADTEALLVFIHDDVWIDDYFLADRVRNGLRSFDVLGVAGNRRRLPNQLSWIFPDETLTRDEAPCLTGVVAHGPQPFGIPNVYGPVPAECELLDGVFLACGAQRLRSSGVAFDRRFDFHCYDLDFCRTARQRGLTLGTWPICLTHSSCGNFRDQHFREMHQLYLAKWGS